VVAGLRPGGFNRSSACYQPGINNVPLYCSPSSFTSDSLTNNELGWKTQWFGHRLQWNGAIYQEDWNNVQVNLSIRACSAMSLRHERADLRVRVSRHRLIAVITSG